MRDPGRNTWTVYEPAADGSDLLPPAPFDALTDPSVEDLLPAGLSFWPRGAAWGTPDGQAAGTDTVLAGFTRALLSPFADLYRRAWLLTQESRALTLVDSLPDWEADYGLPDACSPDPAEAARRRALLTRVRAVATITPQDFIQLARQEGFDIAIEEPAQFECGFSECGGAHTVGDRLQEVYWIVHVYGLAVDYFRCGESECGHDPLFAVAEVERLQCLFARLAPGWTQPVYVVHEQTGAEGLLESFESGLAFDFIDETYASRVEGEPDLSATGPWHQAPGLSFSRGSSAYRTNASGVMESVASGVLRFDHDPVTLAPRGLLMEGACTNSIHNNSMQGAGPGVLPTNWQFPANPGIPPTVVGKGVEDGIEYVDIRWTGTAINSAFGVLPEALTQITAAAGQTWSAGFFIRLVGGSMAGILASTVSLFEATAAGATIAGSATTYVPTSAPLKTQRPSVTMVLTDPTSARVFSYWRMVATVGAAIDITLRFGWPPIVLGSFLSSPIRTTNGPTTRAADSLVWNLTGLPFNSAGGSIILDVEFERIARTTPVTYPMRLAGPEGYIALRSSDQIAGTDLYVVKNGVVQADSGSRGVVVGQTYRYGVAWADNDFAFLANGGAPEVINSGALPTGLNQLILGEANDGAMRLKRFAYYQSRLSNAELQALTT